MKKKDKKKTITVELLKGTGGGWYWRARSNRKTKGEKPLVTVCARKGGYFQVQNARRGATSFFKSVGADLDLIEFVTLKVTWLWPEKQMA